MSDPLTPSFAAPCTCVWDHGDGYTIAPSPIDICDVCIGGMEQHHLIARALNVHRFTLDKESRLIVLRAMNTVGLHPYTGLTEEQQHIAAEEGREERSRVNDND